VKHIEIERKISLDNPSVMPKESPASMIREAAGVPEVTFSGAGSDPFVDVPIEAARPQEKTQKFPARVPYKTHDFSESQGLSFLAGVRLYPPSQILTPPWSEAIAARCIPNKTNRS
jgi:hypothetical protein